MYELAWHFDFHSHRNIRINHDPDVAGIARTLRECGIEEIITFAKGHNGFAYYPTRVGTVHPRMKGDAFGDVVRACDAEGVRVMAYISFGIDGEAGRKRPEWAQVLADGPRLTDDWYISLCPFTPYLDELMLPMIDEVLAAYPVSGVFFDTMGAMGICYCEWCEKAFRKAHDRAIPRDPDDEGWSVYGQFRHDRSFKMIERIGRFIVERKPEAKVGWNQVGTVRYPERMPRGTGRLTLDFSTAGPQSGQASMCAAYGATANLPSDVMSTIFNQGWGDWTPRPRGSLEQEAAAVWARKCRPYLGDRLHPANRLDPISVRAMKFMAGVAQRVRQEYPAEDSRLAPDVLVVHGPGQMYGEEMREFAISREGIRPVQGAHHLLLDAGANFAIAAECFLPDHVSRCSLVVLPELRAIAADTEALLKAYVERGGRLLVVGRPPNVNGRPLDWLGVTRAADPWQDHVYLPLWKENPEQSPVMVRGDFHKLALNGAEAVLPAIRPYDCDHGVRFGWGMGPAADAPSEHAALTRCAVARGEAWHLEAPIFSCYATNANWTQIGWFRALLDRLIPRPAVQVISPAGTVEVVAHASDNTTWAFLVNHGGEQLNGERQWARTLAPVPGFPIILKVRDAAGRVPQAVTVKGAPIGWTLTEGAVEMEMSLDEVWRVVRVDWK